MDLRTTDDSVTRRIKAFTDRVSYVKENGLYFYNQPIEEILPGMRVRVRGREMGMYAFGAGLSIVLGFAVWIAMEFVAPEAALPPQFAGLVASASGMVAGSVLASK